MNPLLIHHTGQTSSGSTSPSEANTASSAQAFEEVLRALKASGSAAERMPLPLHAPPSQAEAPSQAAANPQAEPHTQAGDTVHASLRVPDSPSTGTGTNTTGTAPHGMKVLPDAITKIEGAPSETTLPGPVDTPKHEDRPQVILQGGTPSQHAAAHLGTDAPAPLRNPSAHTVDIAKAQIARSNEPSTNAQSTPAQPNLPNRTQSSPSGGMNPSANQHPHTAPPTEAKAAVRSSAPTKAAGGSTAHPLPAEKPAPASGAAPDGATKSTPPKQASPASGNESPSPAQQTASNPSEDARPTAKTNRPTPPAKPDGTAPSSPSPKQPSEQPANRQSPQGAANSPTAKSSTTQQQSPAGRQPAPTAQQPIPTAQQPAPAGKSTSAKPTAAQQSTTPPAPEGSRSVVARPETAPSSSRQGTPAASPPPADLRQQASPTSTETPQVRPEAAARAGAPANTQQPTAPSPAPTIATKGAAEGAPVRTPDGQGNADTNADAQKDHNPRQGGDQRHRSRTTPTAPNASNSPAKTAPASPTVFDKATALEGTTNATPATTGASSDAEAAPEKILSGSVETAASTQTSSRTPGSTGTPAFTQPDRALAWLQARGAGRSSFVQSRDGWRMLEMKLQEGDGSLTIKTKQDDDRMAVSVGFTDARLRSLASASAQQIQNVLQSQYNTTVDLSLMKDGNGSAHGESSDGAGSNGSPSARNEADAESTDSATPHTALFGGQHEWVG